MDNASMANIAEPKENDAAKKAAASRKTDGPRKSNSQAIAFKRLPTNPVTDKPGQTVTVYVDDQPVEMHPNDTAAAAVLTSGFGYGRTTTVSNSARAPYCMMGVCFECLVEIDGVPNRQSCLIPVRDGMSIRSQEGYAALAPQEVLHHE